MIQISTVFTTVSIAVSIISVAFAIIVGVANMKRNRTTDDKKEATEITTMIVKLENIGNDTKDIKNELRNIRIEVGDLRERVTIAEQTAKSLHRRVDGFETRLNQGAITE
jgi:peptidoglycan hydrolase CwlO-like protein